MCHVEFGVAFFGDVAATQWGCFWLPQRWSPRQSRLLRRGGFFGGGVRNFFPKVWAGCASLWAALSTGVLGHSMANVIDDLHGAPQHTQIGHQQVPRRSSCEPPTTNTLDVHRAPTPSNHPLTYVVGHPTKVSFARVDMQAVPQQRTPK